MALVFFVMRQCAFCVSENGFPSCALRMFASKEAYIAFGRRREVK